MQFTLQKLLRLKCEEQCYKFNVLHKVHRHRMLMSLVCYKESKLMLVCRILYGFHKKQIVLNSLK